MQFQDQKKNKILHACSFILLLVSIMVLQMSFVFAGKRADVEKTPEVPDTKHQLISTVWFPDHNIDDHTIATAYDSMQLHTWGLSEKAFNYAIRGFNRLVQQGRLGKDNIISIVDFSLPSTKKRLFVIDLDNYRVLFNTYVSHGVNSGKLYADRFSNKPASYKSSLGFYETKNTYFGSNGYSLKLQGLEKGINDNAERRAIVIHGAAYVNESLIQEQGYSGRSHGCPALPQKMHKPIIDKIKGGTCLFIYSPENTYLKRSKIINA